MRTSTTRRRMEITSKVPKYPAMDSVRQDMILALEDAKARKVTIEGGEALMLPWMED